MAIGYLDVPASEIIKALEKIELKKNICKVLPRARFYINYDGQIVFAGLICSDMGGDSTGSGASGCENCTLPRR